MQLGKTFQHLQPLLSGWVGTAGRQTVRTFFGTLFSRLVRALI